MVISYKLSKYDGEVLKTENGGTSTMQLSHPKYQEWLAKGNTPDPADVYVENYVDKRVKDLANGGYGTVPEQLEILGEQGIAAYKTHIATVKTNIPKV